MIKWIITAEVAFWIVIIAGLFSRYVLQWKKVSILFFLMTPFIDLALVALTVIDLRNGATATTAHGISVIYIGVSIAYGKTMIAWADEKFQTWFLKKASNKQTLTGIAKGIHEMKMWARHATAFTIGSLLFWGMITFVGSQGIEALTGVWRVWGLVLLIDGVISLSYIIFPKKVTS
ncbi:hypothetical protein SAMN05880501_10686 [Ureibacillus xyleni]|uniref:Intracellular septation protein A n=1 Tax=Ureibacillus xyleni TaxID=614648 RepID=A0A285SX02_9BACL|nr:hypothetical protein [Ureibacillus xyleni]SOC11113.1 hypothetical protein SAMN05880501_10686 [Ureibacillus xyleni]